MAGRRRSPPFALRLSPQERARLERDAGNLPLATYIKWRIFTPDAPPPRVRSRKPVQDGEALSQVLGRLGQSRLANNLNQLARAANLGVLPVTPETEAALLAATAEISEMRHLLVEALGLEDQP